ncbi:MAG TPA: radical SAM protein [bacterium]
MLDVKLKLRPGHTAERTWDGPAALRQLVWNITYACNFSCAVCYADAGRRRDGEIDTAAAKNLIARAREAGVRDVIVSGGEPFMRPDVPELLAAMARHGISARIATNGSLLTDELLRRLRAETLVSSFQVSIDTLDPSRYAALHGCDPALLERAIAATRLVQAAGFHATVSSRVTPATLGDLPALIDLARREEWATLTLHLPVHTRRARDAWEPDTDVLNLLEPVFDHFLAGEHWLVETYIPWAPLHPAMQRLGERVRVVHRGCSAGRDRLTVNPCGTLSPCVCLDVPGAHVGNVERDGLEAVFASAALRDAERRASPQGSCAGCDLFASCRGGCRAAAYAFSGSMRAEDASCPVRRLPGGPRAAGARG